jgi:hypothetical protein
MFNQLAGMRTQLSLVQPWLAMTSRDGVAHCFRLAANGVAGQPTSSTLNLFSFSATN